MFTLRRQVKDSQERKERGGAGKLTPGEIRAQKDISSLDTPPTMKVSFPDQTNIMEFKVELQPQEGYYLPGTFYFTIKVPVEYPHKAPKVHCETKVYHPNIDLEGNVCLNILRQDWKPILTLSSVLYGLQLLFLEPNPDDPLNKEAAETMKRDPRAFASLVASSLRGGRIGNEYFPRVI
uniref:UBC core domain-containing protein n=1 Tax=Compsopogon caeruleus TaxID=31354 RepID=A0A7S1THK1_9RHOD|mmetsp:Transcript_804/g.1717  ORF Transcript_804/g.1717 Transcript_804/m.1717 type:complete len:179 (+) Transcript_804:181-717(+)